MLLWNHNQICINKFNLSQRKNAIIFSYLLSENQGSDIPMKYSISFIKTFHFMHLQNQQTMRLIM